MCLEILLSGTERTLLIQTSDSLPLLCHFLICLLLICLIRDAGDLETEFKLISDSLFFSVPLRWQGVCIGRDGSRHDPPGLSEAV